MSHKMRIGIAFGVLVVLVGTVLGLEALRKTGPPRAVMVGEPTLVPGGIPIYRDGRLAASFVADDLKQLQEVSFVDKEEGKTQQGWPLRDVLNLRLPAERWSASTRIRVSSSSREREAVLLWSEVENAENWVIFDLSGRGTLKLVSVLERLDTRDEWLQDVDRIEVLSP